MKLKDFIPLAIRDFEASLERLKEDVKENPDHYKNLTENNWAESLMSFEISSEE